MDKQDTIVAITDRQAEKARIRDKLSRDMFTVKTLRDVRGVFLCPVGYALPDELGTVKDVLKELEEKAKLRLVSREETGEPTLNDMLLGSFNALMKQVAELSRDNKAAFEDERDASLFLAEMELCRLLAKMTEPGEAGSQTAYDLADITFFLSNEIDMETEK